MDKAGLWRAGHVRVVEVHPWRPRRSRCGELVQWDTGDHDWLEGRGEQIYLISMIDDATSRLFARFVRHGAGVRCARADSGTEACNANRLQFRNTLEEY